MIEPRNGTGQRMVCPRCYGEPLWFRVRSDLMDIDVCEQCGLAAAKLGLEVIRLSDFVIQDDDLRERSVRGRAAF